MAHFHYCVQCGNEYRCSVFLEHDDDSRSALCAVKAHRVCDECAGVGPSSDEADRYDALRSADEQRPHIDANSPLGHDIAKRMRTNRERD